MQMERSLARKAYLSSSRRRRKIRKGGRKGYAYQAPLERAIMPKAVIAKLRTQDDLFTSVTYANKVYGLVATLRSGNDWGNYQNSYQQFNILKVSVRILLGNTTAGVNTAPNAQVIGCAYSSTSTAFTGLNQVTDNQQFWLSGTSNADSSKFHKFAFVPRPTVKPPQTTSNASEQFGYVKFYSDAYGANTVFAAKLVFTFTVAFGAES